MGIEKVDINLIEKYIRSIDPDIFGLEKIESLTIEEIITGHQNINYLITFDDRHDKRFILRYNPKPINEYEKTEFEYFKLKSLDGFFAPKVIFLGRPDFLDGAILVMEFVVGVHKEFQDLDRLEIEELARAVAAIHGIEKSEFSKLLGVFVEITGRNLEYIMSYIHHTIDSRFDSVDENIYISDKVAIDQAREKLNKLIEVHRDAFLGVEFSLLHLDIIPPNVLWDKLKIVFVDWVSLSFGDRADEIAYIFAINDLDKNFQKIFLSEYQKSCNDKSLVDRIAIYYLKNRIFDLSWSITMLHNEASGENISNEYSYKEFYDVRLEALKKCLEEFETL